ncbi:hypothetical protein C8Q74DRAFT_792141 [Fomes fomentarius]|nr:hypothetical protein C8Q74DRAFT_792141 [Fomes fomentarius]
MAKSTRSKVKRAFRAKKRQDGVYAVTEAARLQRLNLKLCKVVSADKEEFAEEKNRNKNRKEEDDEDADADAMPVEEGEGESADAHAQTGPNAEGADAMDLDSGAAAGNESSSRISTHGPRGSRREQWRLSKGMPARPKTKGMNRQGGLAARRKAGRSQRRR